MAKKIDDSLYQWYIATTYSGREDSVVRDLQAKIKSLNLDEYVRTIRTFKTKITNEKIYDSSNPPPAHMRNTKNAHWEAGNKPGTYKKVETKIVNKYPGYIFIHMVLNDKVWLAIRNSFYITGFVGSSGKGAKPIPISADELQTMLADDVLLNEELKQTSVQDDLETKNEISEVKKLEDEPVSDNAEIAVPVTTELEFQVGDLVRVVDGEFKDQIGTIRAINLGTKMVSLDIDFLGSLNNIEVKLDNIELVK